MSNFKWRMRVCGVLLLWATAAVALPAQNLHTVHSFDGTDGGSPNAGLVQGTDGKFYGTTFTDGANGGGTVFSITAGGKLTTLYDFCSQSNCADGDHPYAGLVQGTDGDFYGTTMFGGNNSYCNIGCGTIFSITPSGMLTTLHNFCSQGGYRCTDGAYPYAGMFQGADGRFYGTTYEGGAYNAGTVFQVTTREALTTIYNFCSKGGSGCTDGANPFAALIQGADSKFYGTTYGGGAYDNWGTVFSITAGGRLKTLHSFNGRDGEYPSAGLVQDTNGDFYGTTRSGGTRSGGTVFSITAAGKLKTLYSFCSASLKCSVSPYAGLIQGTDGNLYGTTSGGTTTTVRSSGSLQAAR
jgi:uncharacterized repeat protein (TIGR03803 family)